MYNIKYILCFDGIKKYTPQITVALIFTCLSFQFGFAQNGLMAEYFDGQDFDKFVSAKYVENIDDRWYDTPPVEGIDPHNCSIRWTGKLRPSKTASYIFSAQVDDGIRVWIDGEIIINQWNLNDVGVFSGKKHLVANEEYDIKVEYFNALREGEIQLLWDIEKTKEELSWYERVFGAEYVYQVIHGDYFIKPDGKLPTLEVAKESVPPTKKPQEKVPLPIIKKPKEASVLNPTTPAKPAKEIMTVAKAEKYIPKDVQFVRAESEILPSSEEELNTFAIFMLDHPQVTVLIEGHTDAVGIPAQNQFLSERRANRVARYLVQKGIPGDRIKTVGYGGSRPLKVPAEGEYYPPNRRVVFLLDGLE